MDVIDTFILQPHGVTDIRVRYYHLSRQNLFSPMGRVPLCWGGGTIIQILFQPCTWFELTKRILVPGGWATYFYAIEKHSHVGDENA